MESCINIIIRSGSQQYSDLDIKIRLDSTVADLKEKIEREHPASPKASLQKLIYDGKILINQHQLNAIVKENDVVIHLVYVYDSYHQTAEPARKQETSIRNRLSHVPVPDPIPILQEQPAYSQAYNAWMQQYHHQYSYYMQYYYDLANSNAGITFSPQSDAIQEDAAAVPDQLAPEPEQQVPNVDAALAADDEEGQDWLDALFAFTRFLMMLSIIYFYSTTFRFAIAMALLLIVHLYQAGFFQVNRRAPPPQRNQNNPQDLPEGPVPDDNNNSETNPDNENVARPPPSLFATAVCFIRSFFSSLIPTGPPGVVN